MKNKKHSFQIRTDLAIEAQEIAKDNERAQEVDGIEVMVEEDEENAILVTSVVVQNEKGAKKLGKPIGSYITIESQAMKENDLFTNERVAKILAGKIASLKKLEKDAIILIVGLGNWKVTPDALGPKVVSKVLVSRHIMDTLPEEIDESVRSVCAIAPGVMGITGIETGEIVKGIVEKIKPDLVIAIDALAARKSSRINATIQLSDTGVAPGAGMGNKRLTLDESYLGVPVIAVGVPTVVDAATLVNDTMSIMLSEMLEQTEKGTEFYKMLAELDEEEKYILIKQVLNPTLGDMYVTPKDMDAVMERLAKIIANALNQALHPGIGAEDINRYLG